jgi:hypothetical protein
MRVIAYRGWRVLLFGIWMSMMAAAVADPSRWATVFGMGAAVLAASDIREVLS